MSMRGVSRSFRGPVPRRRRAPPTTAAFSTASHQRGRAATNEGDRRQISRTNQVVGVKIAKDLLRRQLAAYLPGSHVQIGVIREVGVGILGVLAVDERYGDSAKPSRLRIWGSGVRLSPSAPLYYETLHSSCKGPFLRSRAPTAAQRLASETSTLARNYLLNPLCNCLDSAKSSKFGMREKPELTAKRRGAAFSAQPSQPCVPVGDNARQQ
jgi:hypothetical protein